MHKQQLKDLLVKVESFHTKLDRELADAVLGVAIKANWQTAQELRGDGNMCEALMELMVSDSEFSFLSPAQILQIKIEYSK